MTTPDTTTPAAQLESSLTELAADMVKAQTFDDEQMKPQAVYDQREALLEQSIQKHRAAVTQVADRSTADVVAARQRVRDWALDVQAVDEQRTSAVWVAIAPTIVDTGKPIDVAAAIKNSRSDMELASIAQWLPRTIMSRAGLTAEARQVAAAQVAEIRDLVQERHVALNPPAQAAAAAAHEASLTAGVANKVARELASGRVRTPAHVQQLILRTKNLALKPVRPVR